MTADEIAAMQVMASFAAPDLTQRMAWQPCHDWNGGRGLPGSAEALLMTCNQCGQTVASPLNFSDAKECNMRLAPNSWLGINPGRFAVEHLQNDLATERQARARLQGKCEGMAEQAEADQIKIEAQADDLKRLRGVLAKMHQGWANALELNIIAERHRTSTIILRDDARAALEINHDR